LHLLLLVVTPAAEFHLLDAVMFRKALQALATEGKAVLICGAEPDDSSDGVKFL
jgi:hypothetical protein